MIVIPSIAATLQPGDRLVLRKPIHPGEGNSYPRHLQGTVTAYTVLRMLPADRERPNLLYRGRPHPDDGVALVIVDDGNFLGTQRLTFEQVDERLASGELRLERKSA